MRPYNTSRFNKIMTLISSITFNIVSRDSWHSAPALIHESLGTIHQPNLGQWDLQLLRPPLGAVGLM